MHGKNFHKEQKHFPPFVISVDGVFGKEALALLSNLSRLMAKKWTNPFCTCVAGLLDRSKSRPRGRTPTWFSELPPPVPCRNRIRNGTRDEASACCNKCRARIILRTHPHNIFIHPHDPPTPLFCVSCTRYPWPKTDTISWDPPKYVTGTVEYRGKIPAQKQGILCINQKSDGNWTEIGRTKVTYVDFLYMYLGTFDSISSRS